MNTNTSNPNGPHKKHEKDRSTNDFLVIDAINAAKRARKDPAPSDVLGSYTGVPLSDDRHPVQDADDL